jgi:hypothetical protein
MATNLEAAESSAIDYSEALRAKVKGLFLGSPDLLHILSMFKSSKLIVNRNTLESKLRGEYSCVKTSA